MLPFITALNGPGRLHAVAAAAFLFTSAPPMALMAQGLDAEGAIDAIVGSDVTTGEERAAADEARILAAIENASAAAEEARKKVSLDRVEIIFLPDLGEEETAVEARLAAFEPQIAALREAIQGSAMLYHAVNSRSVMLDDVVALEFGDDDGVTIFVRGEKPPGQ